jgi:hypothetical protein
MVFLHSHSVSTTGKSREMYEQQQFLSNTLIRRYLFHEATIETYS